MQRPGLIAKDADTPNLLGGQLYYPCRSNGEGSEPSPPIARSRLIQPNLAEVGLVSRIHAVVLNLWLDVDVELAPVGLDDDAGTLKGLLDVLHQHLALFRVGNPQGVGDLLVEIRIGIGRLVPGLA